MANMGGDPVPDEWKGGLKNLTYVLGGQMRLAGLKVKLSTHNIFRTEKSANILGYIRGSVEADRYVILSNHR